MGVIMMLDRAGSESDEATTPAFREWVAGQTYEEELEFAHCPDAKIHGFRVVFYPYQVRPFFPPSLPPSCLLPSLWKLLFLASFLTPPFSPPSFFPKKGFTLTRVNKNLRVTCNRLCKQGFACNV